MSILDAIVVDIRPLMPLVDGHIEHPGRAACVIRRWEGEQIIDMAELAIGYADRSSILDFGDGELMAWVLTRLLVNASPRSTIPIHTCRGITSRPDW